MLNLSNIKKQVVSLVLMESIVLGGLAAAPSFAHKHKSEKATAQSQTEDRSSGEKLALVEGTVVVHEGTVVEDETPVAKPPMTLKQVEKYNSNFDFGGAFTSGSI